MPAKQFINKELPLFIRVAGMDNTATLFQQLADAGNALIGVHSPAIVFFDFGLPVREVNG